MSSSSQTRKILTVCLSPGLQQTYILPQIQPGEVNRALHTFLDPAGKGINVCRSLAQLGVPHLHLSQGGANSGIMNNLALQEGIQLAMVPSSRPLRTCSTLIELLGEDFEALEEGLRAGQGAVQLPVKEVTEIVQEASPVDDSVPLNLRKEFSSLLADAGLVCITGSKAKGYPEGYISELCGLARKQSLPVLLDVRNADLLDALPQEPDLVKINLDEFLLTFLPQQAKRYSLMDKNGSTEHLQDVCEILSDLTEYGQTSFVITRGPRHVLLAVEGEVKELSLPRIASQNICNPIGSGDAFLAGLAAYYLEKLHKTAGNPTIKEISQAVEFGIQCAQLSARTLRPAYMEPELLSSLQLKA